MTTIDPGRSDMHQILNPRGTDAPTDPTPPAEELDFSLILGGPIYQIFVRSHLSGNGLELLNRRIVVISALAWLPLLVLSIISGHFMSGSALPFLRDVEAHARLLVARLSDASEIGRVEPGKGNLNDLAYAVALQTARYMRPVILDVRAVADPQPAAARWYATWPVLAEGGDSGALLAQARDLGAYPVLVLFTHCMKLR